MRDMRCYAWAWAWAWLWMACALSSPASVSAGLVAHLAFDGDLLDSAGGNDGTAVGGAVSFAAGYDGTPDGAISLAGDSQVQLAHTSGLPLRGHPAFSVAMWVKGDVQSDNRIFSESNTSGNNTPLYNIGTHNNGDNGALDIFIREDDGTRVGHFKTAETAFDGEWHHVAVVDDGGQMRIYIDGVQTVSAPSYTRGAMSVDATTIGGILRGSACCLFTGCIDDVRLYDHALSLTEVLELVPVPAGCISHFRFDGDTLDSVSGNDGTYVGGTATFVDGFDGTPGSALLFEGGQYLDLLQNAGLPLTDNPSFSVAFWINAPTQSDRRAFSEGSTTDNGPLYNIGSHNTGETGALDLFIRRDSGEGTAVNHFKTPRAAFDESWHHVAVVDDDGDVRIYIDGVFDGSFSYVREPLTTDTTTLGGILRATPCCQMTGALDEVRFYTRAIPAEEVLSLVPEPEDCPAQGDTTCGALVAEGPDGGVGPGEWTFTAQDVMDDSGDPPIYIFEAISSGGEVIQLAPQASNVATIFLPDGNWTVTCTVDDEILCRDLAEGATCSVDAEVIAEPPRTLAHLPLDGDLLDVENGNDGMVIGGDPQFVRGQDCADPGALRFNGTDDLVELSTTDGLPVTNSLRYSIAMWVRGMPQDDRRVYSESNTTGNNTPLFNIGTEFSGMTGQVDLFIRRDDGTTAYAENHRLSTGIAFDGDWHHLVWTDNDGDAVLYIDGVADDTDFSYAKVRLTVDAVTIGGIFRTAPCCLFDGDIDDVRVFNFVLSPEEAAALAEPAPPCTLPQIAGDCNQDGGLNVADVVCTIQALFPGYVLGAGAPTLPCAGGVDSPGNVALMNVNGDGGLDVSDIAYLANHLFGSGPPPAQGEGCVGVNEELGCGAGVSCL